MEELKGILDKLDKLTFIERDGTQLITKEGFTVDYSTKLHHSKDRFGISLQICLNVAFKGKTIKGWGCCDAEDTKTVVDWYTEKKRTCTNAEYDRQDKAEQEGEKLFKKL